MSELALFGKTHLMILATVGSTAAVVAGVCRLRPEAGRTFARAFGLLLAANEIGWYVYRLRTEGFRFPEGLPLNLCDLALWLTVAAALSRSAALFEVAYFTGLGGSSMALLTPDLWAPLLSYPTIYFFLAHGGVVVTLLVLLWTGQCRPRPGCQWRVFALLNAYVVVIAAFNAFFGVNYVYLCRKPANASLLDYLGPWPWYILAAEGIALLLFWLLALPFGERPGGEQRLTAAD